MGDRVRLPVRRELDQLCLAASRRPKALVASAARLDLGLDGRSRSGLPFLLKPLGFFVPAFYSTTVLAKTSVPAHAGRYRSSLAAGGNIRPFLPIC